MSLRENESIRALFVHGAAACSVVLWLALSGNHIMRLSIITGAMLSYWIVKRGRVYPFGRILDSVRSQKVAEGSSPTPDFRLAGGLLRRVAILWLVFLLFVCGLALHTRALYSSVFIGPDLFDRVTGISDIFMLVVSHFAEDPGTAAAYFAMALRAIDHVILVSFSFFFSVTASCCLYWLSLHYRARKSQELPT